jgi:hypothetical protein
MLPTRLVYDLLETTAPNSPVSVVVVSGPTVEHVVGFLMNPTFSFVTGFSAP